MARKVLEKTGRLADVSDLARVYRSARSIAKQVRSLANADPPWLEEEPLTVTQNDDGTYRVHAVMNTEKGRRLLVRKVE